MNDSADRFARRLVFCWTPLLAVIVSSAHQPQAQAGSWVHGRGNVDLAAPINLLHAAEPPEQLMPTIATVELSDGERGFFAKADLGNGELSGRAFINGGHGAAGVNPILGETITFNNTTGVAGSWSFNLDVEGTVETGPEAFPVIQTLGDVGPFRTTFIQFAMHVFPGHTVGPLGAPNAWNLQIGNALFSEVKNVAGFPESGELQNFRADLADSISGTLPLEPGMNSFDFVILLAVQADIPNDVDSSFDFDFRDTAYASIESNVAFTSDSGVFLTGVNSVPEPAAGVAVGLAILGANLLVRRRPRRP